MPRPILLLFLFTLLACNGLMAQETIGLRVDALTSAERDSLVSLSHHAGDPQVIYACVPAGILVFASAEPTASREVLRTRAVSYTHLRAHETVLDLVCRLLLELIHISEPTTPYSYSQADCFLQLNQPNAL